jgi:hypothetical protein
MAGERERNYLGQPCCEGRAPVWDYVYVGGVGGIGGPLSDGEKVAISAVENYGGTFHCDFSQDRPGAPCFQESDKRKTRMTKQEKRTNRKSLVPRDSCNSESGRIVS